MTTATTTPAFGIEVNFLTGRYIATDATANLDQPEWPPHPARLFSAMTAAHMDAGAPDPAEQAALEWLETLPPPAINYPMATPRTSVKHFVPVNDRSDPPDGRPRQERYFPSMTLEEPTVTFVWQSDIPQERASSLDALLANVSRLGHSSSLVSCRLTRTPPDPDIFPTDDRDRSTQTLRAFGKGQLAALKEQHDSEHGAARYGMRRRLPYRPIRYAPPVTRDERTTITSNISGELITFEMEPKSRLISSLRVEHLATALRAKIFGLADDPLPEDLSGHRRDGRPTQNPAHVAFWALPFVDAEYADGAIKGIGISVPRAASADAANALYKAIARWEIRSQDNGQYPLALITDGDPVNLRRIKPQDREGLATASGFRWSEPSTTWATATPIALPRHPKGLNARNPEKRNRAWEQAERIVAQACEDAGLPQPLHIEVGAAPYVRGALASRRYPSMAKNGNRHMMLHARLTFSHQISGPLALGSGRFRGWGLMTPLKTTQEQES